MIIHRYTLKDSIITAEQSDEVVFKIIICKNKLVISVHALDMSRRSSLSTTIEMECNKLDPGFSAERSTVTIEYIDDNYALMDKLTIRKLADIRKFTDLIISAVSVDLLLTDTALLTKIYFHVLDLTNKIYQKATKHLY